MFSKENKMPEHTNPETTRNLFIKEFKTLVEDHVRIIDGDNTAPTHGYETFEYPGATPSSIAGAAELGYTEIRDDPEDEVEGESYRLSLHNDGDFEILYEESTDGAGYVTLGRDIYFCEIEEVPLAKLEKAIKIFRTVASSIEDGKLVNITDNPSDFE